MTYISYDQIDEVTGAVVTTTRPPMLVAVDDSPMGGTTETPIDLYADGADQYDPPSGQNIINLPEGFGRVHVFRNDKYLKQAFWSKSGLVLTLVDEIDDDETFTIINY